MDQLWTWVTDNAAALGVVVAALGVIVAFFAWRWPRKTDPPSGGHKIVHGPKVGGDVGGDAVGRDKTTVQGDQVGRDKAEGDIVHGDKITHIQQSSKAATRAAASRFQLPARNPDFVGRREKVEEIKAALRADGAQVTALEGMGGIGKTDAAVEAVHDLVIEGLFKDAQLFLDLQGFSAAAEPLSAADALLALLQPLVDTTDMLPESEHRLAARFHEATRGLEVLLFLDNARDEAQVRPLLPGHPGCTALITSRNRLSLHGLRPLDVAAMDPAEATDLALQLANRRSPSRIERTQAETVARLCGYFDRAAARAVWKVEDPEPTLSVLEQRSLITYDANNDVYYLHDVLQALTLDELSNMPNRKERLLQDYSDYLTHLFDGAASLEALGTDTLRLAQTIFEHQLDSCVSSPLKDRVAYYLRVFLGRSSLKHRLAYRFWSLGLVYRERRMPTAALNQFERAVEISEDIQDRESIARYSIDLAEALLWDENPDPRRALEIIELGIAQRLSTFEHLHAWSIVKLGDYYFWGCGRMDDAEAAYNRALAMKVSALAKAYALRTLGRIHMNRDRREKAMEYLEQSLAIYRLIDLGGGDVEFTENLLLQARGNLDRGARV